MFLRKISNGHKSTRYHSPENHNFNNYCHENLNAKSLDSYRGGEHLEDRTICDGRTQVWRQNEGQWRAIASTVIYLLLRSSSS
jgi:hypothetical protein